MNDSDEDLMLDADDDRLPDDPPDQTRRYGRLWPPLWKFLCMDKRAMSQVPRDFAQRWTDFFIERSCLALSDGKKPPGFLGKKHHFMQLIQIVLGGDYGGWRFVWNPLAERMLETLLEEKIVCICGHASSGKSVACAAYGWGQWVIHPTKTKVNFTSTTMSDSEGRIWGDVKNIWQKWEEFWGGPGSPFAANTGGKLVASRFAIVGTGTGIKTFKSGLQLIAGGKGHDKDAASKIGFKAERMFLVGDELPQLTEVVVNSIGNLISNPYFQFVGIGNPTSYYDPLGTMAEPEDGWSSINEDTLEWRTKKFGGKCIRFDGRLSPNVVAGREIYKGILTKEKYDFYAKEYGANSLTFWQMCRGYFSPVGRTDAIYWENDFETARASRKVQEWVEMPVQIASLDPAFSHGGDGAVATFGKVGIARVGDVDKLVLEAIEQRDYTKLSDKSANKSEEVVRLFKKDLVARGIHTRNVAVDVSGAGQAFSALLAREIGLGFLEVNFGSKASTLPTSKADPKAAVERYHNKVTELWYVGKSYLRTQQLAGIGPDIIKDLCSRDYKLVGKGVVQVETKDQMKKRTGGKSPDHGDSWAILLELARQRHKMATASEKSAPVTKRKAVFDYETGQWVGKTPKPELYRDLSYSGTQSWGSGVLKAG